MASDFTIMDLKRDTKNRYYNAKVKINGMEVDCQIEGPYKIAWTSLVPERFYFYDSAGRVPLKREVRTYTKVSCGRVDRRMKEAIFCALIEKAFERF